MRALILIGIVVLGAALGIGLGAAMWYSPGAPAFTPAAPAAETTPLTAAPAPVVEAPAPDFSLAGLDGRPTALSDWRGKPVILNFWATWCVPCREELPLLDGVAGTYVDSLTVLAVETGEPVEDVRSFSIELGLERIRVLTDPAGRIGALYLVRGLPTTFFIDSTGIIRRIRIGTLTSADLATTLKQMGVGS